MLASLLNFIYGFIVFVFQFTLQSIIGNFSSLSILCTFLFLLYNKKWISKHANLIQTIGFITQMIGFLFVDINNYVQASVMFDLFFCRIILLLNQYAPQNKKVNGLIGVFLGTCLYLSAYYVDITQGPQYILLAPSIALLFNGITGLAFFCDEILKSSNLIVWYFGFSSAAFAEGLILLIDYYFPKKNNLM
jgi:hypothetical protein